MVIRDNFAVKNNYAYICAHFRLSVFLFFKVIIDADNNMMPTDNLAPSSLAWCRSLGSDATKVSDIMDNRDQKITDAINYGISQANEEAV